MLPHLSFLYSLFLTYLLPYLSTAAARLAADCYSPFSRIYFCVCALFGEWQRRCVHALSLLRRLVTQVCVNPEDLRLLCRKFADAATGDINYPAFVQCVDRVFVNYTVDRLKTYDCAPACPKVPSIYSF